MGDVTVVLLDGKRRVVENVFGWNRRAIEVGIHELGVFDNIFVERLWRSVKHEEVYLKWL